MKRIPKFILACLASVTLFSAGITANAVTPPGMGVTSSTVDTGATRNAAGLTDNRLGSYSTAYNDYGATTDASPRDTLYRSTAARSNIARDARNYDSAKLPGVASDTNTPSNRGTAINTDNNINGRYGTDGNSRAIGTTGRDSLAHRSHRDHTIDHTSRSNRITTANTDGNRANVATDRSSMVHRSHTNHTAATHTPSNRGTMVGTDGNVSSRHTTDGTHRNTMTSRDSTVHRNHGHHTIGTSAPSNRGITVNTDGNRANVATDRSSMVHRSHTNHTAAHTPSNRGAVINTNDTTMGARHNTDGNHRTTVVGNNPIISRADRNERNLAGSVTRNVFRNTRRDEGYGYHRHHMRNWFENDANRGNYRAYGDGYVNPDYRGTAAVPAHGVTRRATPEYNTATSMINGDRAVTNGTTVAPRFTTNPTRTATTRGVYRNTTVTESRNATITFVVLLVAIAALLALAIYALTRTRHDRITNTSFSDNEHVNRRR